MRPKFGILMAVLIVFRLLILLFSSELLFAESDEVFRGIFTKEIIDHTKVMPVCEYQYNPYYGGSIIMSLLAVPFFLLFGQTLFSLKMTTLIFAILSFFFLYRITEKYISKTAAVITSSLFIFAPQYFVQRSSIAYGDYCESLFFSLLAIYIFFNICNRFLNLNEQQRLKDSQLYLFFGIICGFAVWFNYIFIITLLTCLIIWFCLDKKFILRKGFILFLLGFLLGFSPWLYYNFTRSFQGCYAGRAHIVSHFFNKNILFSLIRLGHMFTIYIPNALMFVNHQVSRIGIFLLSRIYYLIFLISYIGIWLVFRKEIKSVLACSFKTELKAKIQISAIVKTYLVIYPLIFCFIYSFYNIPTTITGVGFHDYRRLLPLLVFIFIVIAQFLSYCLSIKKGWSSIIVASILSFLIIFGLLNNFPLLSPRNFAKSSKIKGYSYKLLGENISESSISDITRWVKAIRANPRDYWPQVCVGFGEGIGQDLGDDIRLEELDQYLKLINKLDEKYLQYVYFGLGVGTVGAMVESGVDYKDVIKKIDQRYHKDFKCGINALKVQNK